MSSLKWVSGHKTPSLHFHVFPQVPCLASGRQNPVMLCSSSKQACECTAKCIFSAAKGVWKAICWSVCAAEAVWMQHLSLCQQFFCLLVGYDHSRLLGLWEKKRAIMSHQCFFKEQTSFWYGTKSKCLLGIDEGEERLWNDHSPIIQAQLLFLNVCWNLK